jgi:hypothetical protein
VECTALGVLLHGILQRTIAVCHAGWGADDDVDANPLSEATSWQDSSSIQSATQGGVGGVGAAGCHAGWGGAAGRVGVGVG